MDKNKINNKENKMPLSGDYPDVYTDLAKDNLENDIPAADLQDI